MMIVPRKGGGFFLCWGWRLFCCHQKTSSHRPNSLGKNPSEADPIALGALGAWTIFEPDLLVALVAANWDFRKNFEAPVQDRPVKSMKKRIFNNGGLKLRCCGSGWDAKKL